MPPGGGGGTNPARPQRGPPARLVQRDFAADGPDELSVADLSYLRCWEGLVFFAFVLRDDPYGMRAC